MRILVVDGDNDSRLFISDALSDAGYQVTTVSDGPEALEAVLKQPFQIVVSNWQLPTMGGRELCEKIRELPSSSYVFFILLTSRDQDELIPELCLRVDDFLVKPYHAVELEMRVRNAKRIISQETKELTIFALAKLVEKRSNEMGFHLDRIRSYSRILTTTLRDDPKFSATIDEDFVQLVHQTSWLHDIGKISIPDGILCKPGQLSDSELRTMQTHTTQGAQTLLEAMDQFPNTEFLTMAHEIALSHHEKYDGTGYPQQLAGDEIPLSSQIVSLCDAYDAMTSERVYKDACSHETAVSLIGAEAGRQFCPNIVAAFLRCHQEFESVHYRFPESLDTDCSKNGQQTTGQPVPEFNVRR